MPQDSTFDTVIRLLRNTEFTEVAREAIRDYLSPTELAGRQAPGGLTGRELWEILLAIRRFGATTFPIPVATGEEFWYSITVEGRHCLRTIERHCRSDSRLHRMVQHRSGQRFLVSSQVREVIATCQTDGVEVDVEELEHMLHEGRAPRTPAGRLVKNTFEMLGELQSLVNEDFSPDLVRHLFERTTHGVSIGDIARTGGHLRGAPPVFQEFTRAHRPRGMWPDHGHDEDSRAEEVLRQICDYANGKTGDPRESVAVRGYMLLAAMGYWRPLPDFNATVARHMLSLLSVKQDFPVLGYLPVSAMMRRWSLGEMAAGTVRYSRIESSPATADGIDGTAEILVHLQLTVATIDELQARIQATKAEDEGLSSTLRKNLHLNYRQRDILNRALKCPDAEFTLREHRLAHRTAYSTARADLLELAEMGLVLKRTRAQAFVFSPAPDLRSRLDRDLAEAE
jgi:Fic family protein